MTGPSEDQSEKDYQIISLSLGNDYELLHDIVETIRSHLGECFGSIPFNVDGSLTIEIKPCNTGGCNYHIKITDGKGQTCTFLGSDFCVDGGE